MVHVGWLQTEALVDLEARNVSLIVMQSVLKSIMTAPSLFFYFHDPNLRVFFTKNRLSNGDLGF